MGTSAREQRENLEMLRDPYARTAVRVAYHLRKYVLLYVCGALGAIALGVFPAISGGGPGGTLASGGSGVPGLPSSGSGQGASASGPGANGGTVAGNPAVADSGIGAPSGAVATGASGPTAAGTGPGGTGGVAQGGQQSGPVGKAAVGTGTTRGGHPCASGVTQIPWSNYSVPCQATFTGNNGGKTARGVTASTITIAVRQNSDSGGANALESDAETQAAGGVSDDQNWPYIQQITAWLNNQYELFGRKVDLVKFSGQGNGTNEALDQGQAQACADADTVANSIKAFAEFNWSGIYESGVFGDCAARYGIYQPETAPYFPEWWFQQRQPYDWGITMNCSLITQELAEFVGKQIAPFPAKWAGKDGVLNMANTQRKFATYVPSNAEYQSCVSAYLQLEENQYHVSKSREDQYNYALDISTFPQDAQKAIIQFSANHDTTVSLACDPISPIFLTQDAVQQNYYPEWLVIGVAGTDTDNWAQLWDQQAIDGRLFGVSQLADTKTILDANSDAGRSLKAAGVPLNISTVTDYYELISMFNQLQAAGPVLTAANIAAATPGIPEGVGPFGTWYYGKTHSAIIDSREVYWNGSTQSLANGKQGTYVQIYGGKRFEQGQFPSGQPPFFQ